MKNNIVNKTEIKIINESSLVDERMTYYKKGMLKKCRTQTQIYHDDPGHRTSQMKSQQECPSSHHHPNQPLKVKSIYMHEILQYLYLNLVLDST